MFHPSNRNFSSQLVNCNKIIYLIRSALRRAGLMNHTAANHQGMFWCFFVNGMNLTLLYLFQHLKRPPQHVCHGWVRFWTRVPVTEGPAHWTSERSRLRSSFWFKEWRGLFVSWCWTADQQESLLLVLLVFLFLSCVPAEWRPPISPPSWTLFEP